jgi:diacylglycerol O-acyltransferase
MRRLSGTDALFLSMETPAWHQHVGAVVILDPRDAPRFSFEAVRSNLEQRLDHIPKYRWKLKEVPLHLDRAVWIDDPNFDIDRHVRRIAVPPPGGRRQVGDLIGQLMGYQLDRRIPLWELWYVDGVAGDKVALISKYHHCLMDGVSGASMAEQLFDLEPNPPAPPPAPPAHHGEREPSDLELLARALRPTIGTPFRAAGYALGLARRGVTLAAHLRGGDAPPITAPSTPFNRAVGARRQLAFASVSLDDVKRVRKDLDVKVNDVIVALCGGAVRSYLEDLGALPDAPLVAAVPVSTRVADDTEQTNRVANMMVAMATDVAHPVERVRAIHKSSQSAKAMTEAVRARAIQSVGEVAPPLLLNVASRALWASNLSQRMPVAMNVLVSNIPGPPFALYTCGARVRGMYAASVLAANIGMNFTVMSYEDRIDFGLTVDPDLVPDPWRVADGIPAALQELMAAAGLGEPHPVTDPFDS